MDTTSLTGHTRESLIRRVVLWEFKDPSVWAPPDGGEVKGKFISEAGLKKHITAHGWSWDAIHRDPGYLALRDQHLFSEAVPPEKLKEILEMLTSEAVEGGSVSAAKELLSIRREIEGRRAEAWVDPLDVSVYDAEEVWGLLQVEARLRGFDVFLVPTKRSEDRSKAKGSHGPWTASAERVEALSRPLER